MNLGAFAVAIGGEPALARGCCSATSRGSGSARAAPGRGDGDVHGVAGRGPSHGRLLGQDHHLQRGDRPWRDRGGRLAVVMLRELGDVASTTTSRSRAKMFFEPRADTVAASLSWLVTAAWSRSRRRPCIVAFVWPDLVSPVGSGVSARSSAALNRRTSRNEHPVGARSVEPRLATPWPAGGRMQPGINRLKTWILIAALGGLFVLVGGGSAAPGAPSPPSPSASVFNFSMYWFSDKIAIATTRRSPSPRARCRQLLPDRAGAGRRARIPMPKLYVSEMAQPNAFATGRNPTHASVAVTQGILQILDDRELRGVLAHELSHVVNRDILISSVAAAIGMSITFLARFALFFGGGDDNSRGGNGSASCSPGSWLRSRPRSSRWPCPAPASIRRTSRAPTSRRTPRRSRARCGSSTPRRSRFPRPRRCSPARRTCSS